MTEEVKKVAPPGGGFHVLPSEIVEPSPQPDATPASDSEEPDQGDCDACNRK